MKFIVQRVKNAQVDIEGKIVGKIEQGYMVLDPDLQLYRGRQYINDDKNIFGIFTKRFYLQTNS